MTVPSDPIPEPMPGVVPRWEWRVFGDRFDVVDRVVADLVPERDGTSDETYIVSTHTDASVKVRDGLVDVKQRLDTDERGLERWAPTHKATFPLDGDDVLLVLRALGIDDLAVAATPYTYDELVALLASSDQLEVVAVHKHRRHYVVDGCQVESTVLSAGGTSIRTIAVESPDAAQVVDVVRRLGLGGHSNTSVARGLQRLVGFGSRRIAVIDVGTNSVKYHLEEHGADGARVLVDRSEVTRLGEGQADDGELGGAPLARTADAIVSMVADARAGGGVEIAAVGTAGLRRAPNRGVLVDAVADRCGVVVEVISGPEEARLAYLAATSALATIAGELAVFDSGGGSTQFTFGRDGQVEEQFSLYVGAVRITEEFGLDGRTSSETVAEVRAALAAQFDRAARRGRPDGLVGIGGAATNLAAVRHRLVEYDPDVVHGTVLDVEELDRQIELYRSRDAEGRRSIDGLQPARAEVILAGACIVRTILGVLDQGSLIVSDRGLRHGIVIDRFGGGIADAERTTQGG